MPNTVVIGKEIPDGLDFIKALTATGRTVFTNVKTQADEDAFESQKIFGSVWNKGSAVSAHSFLIKAETKLQAIDEVIYIFDSAWFSARFDSSRTEEVSPAVDAMIASYIYSTDALLRRLEQTCKKTTVAFLVKEHPSKHEAAFSKTPLPLPSNPLASLSQAAFISMAEDFSTNITERNYLSVLLARCNMQNELYKSDTALAQWLAACLDTVGNQKNPQGIKQAGTWNKAGAKVQTGFQLFTR